MLSRLKKLYNVGFFSDTIKRKIFQTLQDLNLAWGLHSHSRFDDLDCFKVTGVSEI